MEIPNNPSKQCKTCSIDTGDVWYIFCSIECQRIWVQLKEKHMGQYDVDKDLYVEWLKDKTTTIAEMKTVEEIEARVIEITKIKFFANREWALLHQQYDKITNRKSIPNWIKEDRDKLITEPNIKVDWDGEPRKKEKKPKENLVKNLLGFDIKDMIREMKDKAKGESNGEAKPVKEKPISMGDAMAILLAPPTPKPPVEKPTQEAIQDKAAALKEKMRLAKEAKSKE